MSVKTILIVVYERDRRKCVYCARPVHLHYGPENAELLYATLDHVIPRVRGGAYTVANLVLSCQPCNVMRGHANSDEFKAWRKLNPPTNGERPTRKFKSRTGFPVRHQSAPR